MVAKAAVSLFDKHIPSILVAVLVGLMSWFGKTVVEGNESRAAMRVQLAEISQSVQELRHDAKDAFGQTTTNGTRLAEIERRVTGLEQTTYRIGRSPDTPR